jgi:hypothetical protein
VRINGEDIDERVFLNFCNAIEGSIWIHQTLLQNLT